ncbi:MAG: acetate--CoA ligase family protein [Candidatus Eisenbacteria sp.]|nr:acetate--CoA ligase family protein [Candidatus Eisenbacteria bacterium]
MARLFEYQGKEILSRMKIPIPKGQVARTPEEAEEAARSIGKPVIIKAQAWVTGRASLGGIRKADSADEARKAAEAILGMEMKGFTVNEVLVEEQIDIDQEFYAGVIIDDVARRPVVIVSSMGGTGIEEIAQSHPDKVATQKVKITRGLPAHDARNLWRKVGISGKLQMKLGNALVGLYNMCRKYEARSGEINPLVVTNDGQVMAADCRLTVDDYAVFRHPDLGIEIARELDRPATPLEKIAYQVEAVDYRGTFYFIQMAQGFREGEGYIGFHGAGGGGSMMSMDALLKRGYKIANFTDTSGNPPSSKVYRAARIILSQEGLDGYFASGSGVASQEQFHSARGFVKAFREVGLSIPAVIRLGGNFEEEAIEILGKCASGLPSKLEAYGRDDSPDFCAERLQLLIEEQKKAGLRSFTPRKRNPARKPYRFETVTGSIEIDHACCVQCKDKPCVAACTREILKIEDSAPVLAQEVAVVKKGRCTECLACEIACEFEGNGGLWIDLPIPELKE